MWDFHAHVKASSSGPNGYGSDYVGPLTGIGAGHLNCDQAEFFLSSGSATVITNNRPLSEVCCATCACLNHDGYFCPTSAPTPAPPTSAPTPAPPPQCRPAVTADTCVGDECGRLDACTGNACRARGKRGFDGQLLGCDHVTECCNEIQWDGQDPCCGYDPITVDPWGVLKPGEIDSWGTCCSEKPTAQPPPGTTASFASTVVFAVIAFYA